MNCTKCGNKTEIIDTEKYSMFVWRRRRCMTCNHRMSTHENFVEDSKTCRAAQPKQTKPKQPPKQPKPKPPNVTELPVVNKRRLIESLKEELQRKKECDEDFDGGL